MRPLRNNQHHTSFISRWWTPPNPATKTTRAPRFYQQDSRSLTFQKSRTPTENILNRKAIRMRHAGARCEVKYPEYLLWRSHQPRTDNQEATYSKHRASQCARSPTDVERKVKMQSMPLPLSLFAKNKRVLSNMAPSRSRPVFNPRTWHNFRHFVPCWGNDD